MDIQGECLVFPVVTGNVCGECQAVDVGFEIDDHDRAWGIACRLHENVQEIFRVMCRYSRW